ncbi:MAG: hypothetical protein IJV31_01555 [Clostridia bacterium]|nr:hypothetical protein [Clostridia bacterium]
MTLYFAAFKSSLFAVAVPPLNSQTGFKAVMVPAFKYIGFSKVPIVEVLALICPASTYTGFIAVPTVPVVFPV